MNYILNRFDIQEQIVRTILQVENTSEYECNQTRRLQEVTLPEHYHKSPAQYWRSKLKEIESQRVGTSWSQSKRPMIQEVDEGK